MKTELNIAKSIVKNKLGIEQSPSFITHLITLRCNSRCVFCDVWKQKDPGSDDLTVEEIKTIYSQFKHIDVVRITGGEPFLRTDLGEVINTIDQACSPNMIHITTNGFLTSRTVDAINEIENPSKIHIKVSIDGVKNKHDEARGVKGAYDKAIETIEALHEIQKTKGIFIGVNQAIIGEEEISSYHELKKILKKYNICVYPSIAFQPDNALYSKKEMVDPDMSYKTFGEFSNEALDGFIKELMKDGQEVNNFQEQLVDKYHLRGMYNRIVHQNPTPNPKCVALNNHLRILPNGDVPVCLYNGKVVGSLKTQSLKEIWDSEIRRREREWVKKCPGCWQSCESVVSAIYTGDIAKGLFY